ncbi:hypothetical protein BJ684DRAFT_14528 [Piptocephalis cylindrospora]|uniref:Uncharacterized protein n=1 Tax=Piptocephalis cylindrospora TaxID=1907219 RepID=A0A4P9Y7S7_9FUNG|nr:hypothetical protein BJ684DRAFT_14528 [Piptocephalis cylindrospora]|eukprot:RKP15207.1 hypothetical protein BJ684DRAFT_14528 [Piptocephalis cylindrospora]
MGSYWFIGTRQWLIDWVALPPPPMRPRRWLALPYFNGGCGDVSVILASYLECKARLDLNGRYGSRLTTYSVDTTTYRTFRVEGNYPTLKTQVTVDVSTSGESNAGLSIVSSGSSEVTYIMSPDTGVYTLKVTAPSERGCYFTFPPHCAAAHVTLLLPLGTEGSSIVRSGYSVEVDVGGGMVTLSKGLSMATPLRNLTLSVHRGGIQAEQGDEGSGGIQMENGMIRTWDTAIQGVVSPSSSLQVYGQGRSPMTLDVFLRRSTAALGNVTLDGRTITVQCRDEGSVQVKLRGGDFSGQAEALTDGGYQADLRGPRVQLQKSLVSNKVGLCLGTGNRGGGGEDVALVSAHVGAATLELTDS